MSILPQQYRVGIVQMRYIGSIKYRRVSHSCIYTTGTFTNFSTVGSPTGCKSLWVQGRTRNPYNMSYYRTLSSALPSYLSRTIFHFIDRPYTTTNRAGHTSSSTTHAFPLEHHRSYKSIMKNTILSNQKYVNRKKSLIDQGLWNKDMFRVFEQWLLQTKPAIDENILTERWNAWRKQWMDEYLAAKISNKEESQEMARVQYKSELISRCKALQERILTHAHQRHDKHLISQSFSRLIQFVFHKVIDHCHGGSSRRPSILLMSWYKMKESGAILNAAKLRLLINMVIESEELAGQELLMEELLVYHDLLHGEVAEIPDHHRYPAMLRYYCESCKTDAALRLMRQMSSLGFKPLKSDQFMLVLATLAENGQFRNGGEKLFDEIATAMATQASGEISSSCANRLHTALEKEFVSSNETNTNQTPPTTHEKLLLGQVQIDPLTLTCPLTSVQMSSNSSLSAVERKQMHDDILALANIQWSLVFEMNKFLNWLNNREGPPFTAIVDGANIGKIESEMLSLESEGRSPLAIITERDSASAQIKEYRTENDDKVYIVKNGLDDDLFCILGTVADQQRSYRCSSGKDALQKEPVMLVTNDLFRDHRSKMRDPNLMRSWYRHHIRSQGPTTKVQDSFTPSERKQVFDDVLQLAYKKSTALNDLKAFSDWIVNRRGYPFTVIIDGANVGSIDAMVISLQAKGENPLVIFPDKVAADRSEVSYRLRNSGQVYIVPHGLEDDIFCMFATVLDNNQNEQSRHMNPPRPVLITNDRFLDHKTKMRDPFLVDKWYSTYCFNHSHGMQMLQTNVYRRKIEQNDWPTNTESYSSNSGTKVWHFPVSGWGFYERFVVSLPTHS